MGSLESKCYIHRSESHSDRRTIQLSLTPEGISIVNELSPRARQIERMASSGVSARELEITLKTLRAIYSNLVDNCEDTPAINRKLTVARRVRRRETRNEPAD